MSDVIFCKTRWQDQGYDPYNDFFRLIELSGYPICYVDEIEPASTNTYIVTPLNGEWHNGWVQPRARIILYEMEWRTDWHVSTDAPPGVAEVWAIDAHYARQIGAKYVPIGSHPDLRGYWGDNLLGQMAGIWRQPVRTGPKCYDAAMLSYMVSRRQTVALQFARLGFTLAPSGWGQQRDEILQQSRAMLHVHQHEHIRGVACLRWALAAAYKLPILTETLWDGGIFRDREHMLVAEAWALAQTMHQATISRLLEPIGEALHQLLCVERTFRRNVEAAL